VSMISPWLLSEHASRNALILDQKRFRACAPQRGSKLVCRMLRNTALFTALCSSGTNAGHYNSSTSSRTNSRLRSSRSTKYHYYKHT